VKSAQLRRWIFPTFLVLFGAAVCARLGIWQLDRLAQRRDFNSHYLQMKSSEPLVLSDNNDLTGMEYRAVVASGVFDHSNQIAIRNQYVDGQYGFHLLTPLVLESGTAVLVDRGWIPAEGNSTREGWSRYDENGLITVEGVIRLAREKADFTGKSDPELSGDQKKMDFWLFPNIVRIQEQFDFELLPVYIQKNPKAGDDLLPIPVQPEVEISEGPHFGYALQWFTFSTILLFGYPFYLKKQLKSHPNEMDFTVENE
jgi:surfeit locus 1 family protein